MNKAVTLLAGALLGFTLIGNTANAGAYTVNNGDTLWKIAAANGIDFNELRSLNPSIGDWIYPGQTIRLPDLKAYTVQQGDTFWKIALKLGVTTRSLIDANPQIGNPDILNPGDRLNVPAKSLSTASTTAAAAADGQFPLKANTYKPYTNNFAEGRTWSPDGQEIRPHEGVDIFADKGTPVYSAKAGKIVRMGWNEYGGWRLTVQVDDATAFYYAHLSGYADGLALGGTVAQGQLIGYVGNTGYGPEGTEGLFDPHLHFGIYRTSPVWKAIDPYSFLTSVEKR
ncbi:M23 family metallopeptidase [Paenibacillus sp. GYB003]|uniref:M23 family metallopeptidase n=1 Tax=Paenibacillus sp. GYB003 TaxID=2994392 RepID=UPI002F964E29